MSNRKTQPEQMQKQILTPSICQKHNKSQEILVVNQAVYICEDCAIFESKYKNEMLLQKESLPIKLQNISHRCLELGKLEKANQTVMNENLRSLLNSVDAIQSRLIDQIRGQFKQIKTDIQKRFIATLNISESQRGKNGKSALIQLLAQTHPEYKVKKENQSDQKLSGYEKYLERQLRKINKYYQQMKQHQENTVEIKIDIKSAFDSVINSEPVVTTQSKCSINEDDLLDFSQFSIRGQSQNTQSSQIIFDSINAQETDSQMAFFKRPQDERMKTASCLEDSACSIESTENQNQIKIFHIPINQPVCLNQSMLSERSISCSSVISKALTCSTVMPKQPSKKSIIQVCTMGQLQTKLLSISPTIKIIRLKSIPITAQQFSSLLKEKIAKSFIHTLEITACPKLNEKILMGLKMHRCKTLKKVEIRECKEINWVDKKVKDSVRKLEADAVKVIC